MRNTLNLLIFAALTGSMAAAQQPSGDVDDILSELMNYSEEAPAAEEQPETPVEELVAEAPVEEPEAAPVETRDVEAMIEQSREQFLGGKFIEAQQGFERVLAAAPENMQAQKYLRALRERDYRIAAIDAMEATDAAWNNEMVFRSYALSSEACERMELEEASGTVDIRALFPQVEFPQGAKAICQPEENILFVRNTAANLSKLEAILDATGVLKNSGETDQVEISAKFVEVSEGALEELGFQWNFDDPTGASLLGADLDINDNPDGLSPHGLFADSLRGSPSNPELPFRRPGDLGDGFVSASGDWGTFRFEDAFDPTPASIDLSYTGGTAFDMVISALDQSSGADVLSAPRVVTKSGEKASIRVGERHFFPEVFEGAAEAATMLSVAYEDFKETLLGVELSVTPEVDGNQIELGLNPRIVELAGWQEFQMAPANSIYNHRQDNVGQRYRHDPVVARLPVLKNREIETNVRIADGSTIGMGGLINEKIETYEDRVPVLGHIPLIGRLFRNEGERAIKRNLLIFVTARKVDPNGRIYSARSFE